MTWGTFSTCPISLFSSTLKTCSTKTSQPLRVANSAGMHPTRRVGLRLAKLPRRADRQSGRFDAKNV